MPVASAAATCLEGPGMVCERAGDEALKVALGAYLWCVLDLNVNRACPCARPAPH
jgi:hypothetical protein